LECINKSYYYLDAFVGYFIKMLQNARPNYQDKKYHLEESKLKCVFERKNEILRTMYMSEYFVVVLLITASDDALFRNILVITLNNVETARNRLAQFATTWI
jgi:hypothetical protein